MAINLDEEDDETNKSSQKTSLRSTIASKKKNWCAKKFTINHLIPILFFLFLSIFIFRGIIGADGVILQGDFAYPPELDRFSQFLAPMWDEYSGTTTIATLPRLMSYLPFFTIGSLFEMSTTEMMVLYFIFYEFLAGVSIYYASRYILGKTYKKITHKIMTTKIVRCPSCKNKVTISGYPGEKVSISCPKCGENGTFYFPEKQVDLKKTSRIIKVIKCSGCKNKVTLSGNPGEKVYITCPKCGEKGIFYFPEEQKDFKTTSKTHAIEVDNSLQNRINIASLLAGLAYMWSYYLIFNFKYPHHRAAYALAPFILLFLIMGLENKKLKYIILTGFLWSVACADMHFTVDGMILLFCFIFFYFVFDIVKSSYNGILSAFKRSLFFHLKSSMILLGSFICFSAYWLVPGFLMGGSLRYSAVITIENLEYFYSQSSMLNLLSKQASNFQTSVVFDPSLNIFSSSVMQNLLILLGLVVFIIGIMALILKRKNKYVLFFSVFALISIFLASISIFSIDIGIWIVSKAPLHQLYGWAFKWPIISQFIMLSLCFLLGFSMVEILTRIKRSRLKGIKLKKVIAILIICVLLFSILLPKWPLATGDMNGWLKPAEMPDDFAQVNSWLEEQDGDFKVLWLPKYRSKEVIWYQGHKINKDIAGFSSSKPTYAFWSPQKQPNAYGIYTFTSTIYFNLNPDSMIFKNATKNLGKLLAPLGIKYVIFHNDNATYWNEEDTSDILLDRIKNQEDLELIREFGIIYVFENKYYDEQQSSHIFPTSNDFLVYGGLASLSTLNYIPYFQPDKDGLIFDNQRRYDMEKLNEIVDGLIFTRSSDLEEMAIDFADGKYIIVPFDYTDYGAYQKTWAKRKLVNPGRLSLEDWDWEYDEGIVYTKAFGSIKADVSVSDQELIRHYIFETGLDDFQSISSNLSISLDDNSAKGAGSLSGIIDQGESRQNQIATSALIPILNGSKYYRISFYLAAADVNNVQVRLRFYDAEEKLINQRFILTESGNFEYKQFEKDIYVPSDATYYAIQILGDQNPIAESYWWIDDIRIYDLRKHFEPNILEIDFKVDETDNYDLFMRYLKGENGGTIALYLDEELIGSLNTIDTPQAFDWELVKSVWLKKGSHSLAIENVDGFNAVNLIAITPEKKTEEYLKKAEEFLKNKELIYVFEAESDFYFENATISSLYGNTVSSGKVLNLSDNGVAWLPVQILQDGNYSLSIRRTGGGINHQLNLTLGDNYYDLGYNNDSDFTWINITGISLNKGYHDIKFKVDPPDLISHLSFEEGWNSTSNSPEAWSSPQTQFSASLDNLTKTDGEYSLKLTTDSTGSSNWSHMRSQNISVEPNVNYRASIDIKTKNVNNTRVKIIGYNESSEEWEHVEHLVIGPRGTKGWREYSHSFSVSKNISKIKVAINAGWVLNSTAGNATTWFDNFKLFLDTEEKNNEIDLVILYSDENNQTLEDLFESNQKATILESKKIDATKYEVKISSTEPFMLGFAEAFDDFWIVHIDGLGTIESTPLHGMLNGFYINKTGNFTVIIEFKPQQWFNIGAGITGLSILVSFGLFILIEEIARRKKQKGLLKRLIRISKGRQK